MVRLRQVLRPLRVPVDVLVYLQAEINQQQGSCATAVYWALREGRVLYEETPYINMSLVEMSQLVDLAYQWACAEIAQDRNGTALDT